MAGNAFAAGGVTALARSLDDSDLELTQDGDTVDIEDYGPEAAAELEDDASSPPSKKPDAVVRRAILLGLVVVAALSVLVGWLGFRAYESQHAQTQRNQFVQVARQGALNLATIDWQHADTDVQRILDGATGGFYDDFAQRSQPFVDVVKQAKSTTVGTITEAGVESETADTAQVLVAMTVKASNAGTPEQDPRAWRIRISVQKVGEQAKVSNVEFVP
jgi:Mce-associated membrane protein